MAMALSHGRGSLLSSASDSSDSSDCTDSSSTTRGRGNQNSQTVPAADAKAMSLQGSEALSRTFQELKSKNQEVRLKASYDLYSLIVLAARGNQDYRAVRERN